MDRQKLAEWQRRLAWYERTSLTTAECCQQGGDVCFRFFALVAAHEAGGSRQRPSDSHQVPAFAAIEIIARRSLFVRFPGGTSLEIPDDRIDLVRLPLDRRTSEMEAGEC